MPEIRQLTQMFSVPGIQRDGTLLDRNYYSDGQWVRFQRGRPKKMGGFQLISDMIFGPVRQQLVWSKGTMNCLYNFSSGAISLLVMNSVGGGANVYDLSPVGFTDNANNIWSVDTMFDAAGSNTIVIAVATNSLAQIDDSTAAKVYYAVASDTASAFAALGSLTVSGGICVVTPYLMYYGALGLVGWSDANQPLTLTGGDAGSARVTGAKVIKGLPLRGGSGPAALFWSLDSLIRADWVGGSSIFRFTTVTAQSSVLSQNGIIEYDGNFYWPGVDRFLVYSGGSVSELPNNQNQNFFYDNLNFEQRQKVWAMKVPRYGEIWWFFPYGTATECTNAVIYNVREKTWYDCALARSAGYYSQVFRYPTMATAVENKNARWLVITIVAGAFSVGDVLKGVTSGMSGNIIRVVDATDIVVYMTVDDTNFIVGETLSNSTSGGTATLASKKTLCSTYVHEKGTNQIDGGTPQPISSYFDTCDFGYVTGGAQPNAQPGPNRLTRIIRVEPDFVQNSGMYVQVFGKEYANGSDVASEKFVFESDTEKVDMREQRREIRLRFGSNSIDGHFEMGNVLLHIEPGDVRP